MKTFDAIRAPIKGDLNRIRRDEVTLPPLLRSLQRSLGCCVFLPELMLCRDAVVFETPPLGTAWLQWGSEPQPLARLVVWDTAQHAWRDALRAVKHRAAFSPVWILTGGVAPTTSCMLEAWRYGITLVWTPLGAEAAWYRTHSALFGLVPAPEYGTVVRIKKQGVLICGAAGIGKSSVAQTVIAAGHALVADDAPLLERVHGRIIATCPAEWRGRLRIGSFEHNVRLTYGINAYAKSIPIQTIVHLIAAAPELHPKGLAENGINVESPMWNCQRLLGRRLFMRVIPAQQPWTGLAVLAAVERIILERRWKLTGND